MGRAEVEHRRSRWTVATPVVVLLAALVAACVPPGAPAPSGPPEIRSFTVRSERSAAPAIAVTGWDVAGAAGAELTCRVDTTGDGAFDRTVSPCRKGDRLLVEVDAATERTLTLELDDGVFAPVRATAELGITDGPDEAYSITLRLDPSMRVEFAEAFRAAAARWEEVLVAGVPDQELWLPDGFLGWVPGFDGVVDDVLIDARATEFDGPGGILGRAGGLLIREGRWHPYWGIMEFDEADLDVLAGQGRLEDVILHEMGHVLGLGANWLLLGLIRDPLTDPAYTGRAAVAAYQELGGGRHVPVENVGQWGTILGHWRESRFDNELMTGYLNADREQPLSRVSVAALADLGYGVDLSAADPYELPPVDDAEVHDSRRLEGFGSWPGHDDHGHDDDSHVPHTEPLAPLDGPPARP